MPPSDQPRVFISYARKDGAALAQRLQPDLTKQGFDAWLDKTRISGGASWTREIETALDQTKYVLALLTTGSYVSEMCRAEQLRALRKGKCVIPLLAERGADVPLYLETKNYRDFTSAGTYGRSFSDLLSDINSNNGVILKEQFRHTSYVTVPPLPNNYVERPEALASLRAALINDDGGMNVALTALQGMGGIGKTILAQALCREEVVQQAFPDGIIWTTVGKEPTFDLLTRLREVGKALGDDLTRYDSELGAKNQYRSTMFGKAALVVVDDVWRPNDLEPFLAEGAPRSRVLFTTRDARIAADVGAREQVADLLSEEQSREVLARWSGNSAAALPPDAGSLIEACGRLPLALSMIGAMLRGKPPAMWARVLELLREAELEKVKAQFPGYPYPSVFAAIKASVDALDDVQRKRYLDLAVLPEDMPAAPQVQQCLWGLSQGEALETAEKFVSLSLAQRDKPEGSIRLHDLQLDYVRAQWPGEDREALELIQSAIRLSSSVIANDPGQFASQMVGRLLQYLDMPTISRFTKRVADATQQPWLRPLQPVLHPAGTALIRTLPGYSGLDNAVAVTADGKRVVSSSDNDEQLKVWDVDSGRELRTLSGHRNGVTALAVTPDGQRAVSGSDDETLKVWDLERGTVLRTLSSHSGSVAAVAVTEDGLRAVSGSHDKLKVWDLKRWRVLRTLVDHTGIARVAVTPDGRIAVSASEEKTLKVWDLDNGRELRTLSGHSRQVRAVAVTTDGQRAVSASDDKTLKVWDLSSGQELRTLAGHAGPVNAVAVTRDGQQAISGSWDRTLKVWDIANGRELRTPLTGHAHSVTAVAVTPDGKLAISASWDQTLKVWDLTKMGERRAVSGHKAPVVAIAITLDGQRAISASYDGKLKVWDLASGRETMTLSGHKPRAMAVAVTPDGQTAVSASDDKTLKVWYLGNGQELRTLAGHSDNVTAVAVTPDGRTAVSGSADGKLKVWNLESGRELRTFSGHSASITALAVMPDGQRVVSASENETLKLWDLASGREIPSPFSNAGPVSALAVTRDGLRMVAASAAIWGEVDVWELARGGPPRPLPGDAGFVLGLAVMPDGQRAVSAAEDNTVKVWDLETGRCLATFTCDSPPHCCAYSDALRLIVAGDAGGHVHFLRLEEPKPRP